VSSRALKVVHVAFLLFGVCSDNADDADLPRQVSDSESAAEDETEDELWRRKRYEREMFLQQHKVCTNFINRQDQENAISHTRKFIFYAVKQIWLILHFVDL
jgi:hypothetical protein